MIVAKTDMEKIPDNCWECDYTHDASNGLTVCSMLKEPIPYGC